MKPIISLYQKTSIVLQIVVGILLGIFLGFVLPSVGEKIVFLGHLFVGALKAVAPILVLVLVASSIATQKEFHGFRVKKVLVLYLIGTFLAAVLAVIANFIFPSTLVLKVANTTTTAPQGVLEVLNTLLFNIVTNPVTAISQGNYIGILFWGVALGITLHKSSDVTKVMLSDLAEAFSKVIKFVIAFAPLGICGLITESILANQKVVDGQATTGWDALLSYGHLLAVLLGCMILVALVLNPLLIFIVTRSNPYPLVIRALKESGITAFMTRSSAANIPVNLELCRNLGLDKSFYSFSIPLGATINMAGAAITITTLTLAGVNTLGIQVDFASAVLLSFVATLTACGASGVAGGSLLLIPLACSLFNISQDVAMQIVGVGFIISFLQDSVETALNSSTDVVFTAAASHQS